MNDKDETKTGKDKWQRWLAIATTAIAAIGALATWVYNEQQTRYREIETVEKFFDHLVSPDRRLSNMAKLTVKRLLTDKELADQLVRAAVEVTSDEAATKPELSVEELAKVRTARTTPVEGWAYLGNKPDGIWQTRYFDFPLDADPQAYFTKGTRLTVREATGALNLRQNMPTPEGTFPPVIDVLEAKTEVEVEEVSAWQSTGYFWARVVIVSN